jgi:hypothetical protein
VGEDRDRTVIVDNRLGEHDDPKEWTPRRGKELRGRLAADGVEFDWLATRLGAQWFVTVENPTCGSRGQLTDRDPIDFALALAKQTVALEAAMSRLLREG